MRAAVFRGLRDICVTDVPDASLAETTDAVVKVLAAAICGTDLWGYRGVSKRRLDQRVGHEFLGVVVEVGSEVGTLRPGDLVAAPFRWADGSCPRCQNGLPTSCRNGGMWGQPGADGGQGEAVRVPFADATLVKLPGKARSDDRLLGALLTLTDVMSTGYHAARAAGVAVGQTVAVVGDGAVGLCGVLAARRLGAERIIVLSHHADRAELACRFGATDIVSGPIASALASINRMTATERVDAVLEAVGTPAAMQAAVAIVKDAGTVGYVGVPYEGFQASTIREMFDRNLTLRGGVAPAGAYLPELLPDVLNGSLDPSPVFGPPISLDEVPAAYAEMDARRMLKARISFG